MNKITATVALPIREIDGDSVTFQNDATIHVRMLEFNGKRVSLEKVKDDNYDYALIDSTMHWLFKKEWLKNIRDEIDWSEVAVDARIFVRDSDGNNWIPRHFCKYQDGIVHAWADGKTSFTCPVESYNSWGFSKLA